MAIHQTRVFLASHLFPCSGVAFTFIERLQVKLIKIPQDWHLDSFHLNVHLSCHIRIFQNLLLPLLSRLRLGLKVSIAWMWFLNTGFIFQPQVATVYIMWLGFYHREVPACKAVFQELSWWITLRRKLFVKYPLPASDVWESEVGSTRENSPFNFRGHFCRALCKSVWKYQYDLYPLCGVVLNCKF